MLDFSSIGDLSSAVHSLKDICFWCDQGGGRSRTYFSSQGIYQTLQSHADPEYRDLSKSPLQRLPTHARISLRMSRARGDHDPFELSMIVHLLDILDRDFVITLHQGVPAEHGNVGVDVPGEGIVVVDEEGDTHLAFDFSLSLHPRVRGCDVFRMS